MLWWALGSRSRICLCWCGPIPFRSGESICSPAGINSRPQRLRPLVFSESGGNSHRWQKCVQSTDWVIIWIFQMLILCCAKQADRSFVRQPNPNNIVWPRSVCEARSTIVIWISHAKRFYEWVSISIQRYTPYFLPIPLGNPPTWGWEG